MHEASIAMAVLDACVLECRKHGGQAILRIRIRLGQAAGILPDALLFAFDCAKEKTLAARAELVIDHVALAICCEDCGAESEAAAGERLFFSCPSCRSTAIHLLRGQEMQIVDIDVA